MHALVWRWSGATVRVLLAACAALLLAACAKSGPDVSMDRLAKRGYAYSCAEFQRAARSGDVQALEDFLAAGMVVDVAENGTTAIGAACQGDAIEAIRMLLKAGASATAPAAEGKGPLLLTASVGTAPAALLLMESGADPRARDAQGWHALALAVWHHRVDVATLLATRAAAEELDDGLLLACLRGDLELTDMLLRRGASVRARDGEGRSPLMLAAMNGHNAVVRRLIDSGASRFEVHAATGWTASQFAERAQTEALAKGDMVAAGHCREVAASLSEPPAAGGEPGGVYEDPREIVTMQPDDAMPDEHLAAAVAAGKVRVAQPLAQATLPVQGTGFDGFGKSWRMTEYRERPAPVLLTGVEPDNNTARMRPLHGTQEIVAVKVGQNLPGMDWRLATVTRKLGKKKDDGAVTDLSTAVIEQAGTGRRATLVAGLPASLDDPFVVLSPGDDNGGTLVTARRGDTFKLGNDPDSYVVADIGADSLLLENTRTRQTRLFKRR